MQRGSAWCPFEIYDFPGIPHFPETNLRTYVVGPDGSPRVWFFSLEAARLAAVLGARVGYHLPYFWAKMRVTVKDGVIHYRSRRHWPHDPSAITDIVDPTGRSVPIRRISRSATISSPPVIAFTRRSRETAFGTPTSSIRPGRSRARV